MKTIEECRANIQEFANRWKLIFEDEGEVGIGRSCVGLLSRHTSYIDYNPHSRAPDTDYEPMPEFYDSRLCDIIPEDAYHKHDCLAVLGHGENAIRQLSDWVDALKELNATVVEYETGAQGLQAIFTGVMGYTIKLEK
jgi:hypothetical protein